MAELTDRQVDIAAKVFMEYLSMPGGEDKGSLRVTAPYLQMPWDEPTNEEVANIVRKLFATTECLDMLVLEDTLREFVRLRNAALLPKPVDPRRAAIVRVLREYPDRAPEIADKILAALDEAI